MTNLGRPKRNEDYLNIPIPKEDADRTKFDYQQRRAELLAIILGSGSLRMPVLQLAERYGVTHAQISHDKEALIKYINEKLIKPDRLVVDIFAAKQKAKEEAIKKQDWRTVNQVTDSMLEMAYNLGVVRKEPEEINVNQNVLTIKDLTGAYDDFRKRQKKITISDSDLK